MSLKKFTSGERLLASDLNSMVDQIEANIPMIETTWSNLKTLRDSSQLIPGTTYRITDYNCTTSQYNTSSAGHQFDILVVADDVNKLNENVHAIQHSGDTYFSSCNLSAWELKYCLDNDTSRFAWAVTGETGRGVIYYMKDEWNNECPYDFKNILFTSTYPSEYTYKYTFCLGTSTTDASIDCSNYIYNNSMMPYFMSKTQTLNFNVFFGISNYGNVLLCNCHDNAFGKNYNNVIGNNIYNNTFGNDFQYNKIGNNFQNNKIGNKCMMNDFGHDFKNNTFGNYFQYNTFGNNCNNNTFGNSCNNNDFGYNFKYNTCGEDVKYLIFTANYTTGENYLLRYLYILNGYSYSSSTYVPTGITVHAEFPQFIGYNSSKVFTVKKPLD